VEAFIATTYGGAAVGQVTTVTHWGSTGLKSGDWVMLGERSLKNYIWSGKMQWFGSNIPASYASGQTFRVATSALRLPKDGSRLTNLVKWWLGQRIYKP
jgi:hypothetical protein